MNPTTKMILSTADVSMTLADFVHIESDGKVTLVGAGIRVLSVDRDMGISAPFAVWVTITLEQVPPQPAIVELVLADHDGRSVRVKDSLGGSNEIRLTQPVQFVPHLPQGVDVPSGQLPLTHVIAASFASGILIDSGRAYRWQVELDGRIAASYAFYATQTT